MAHQAGFETDTSSTYFLCVLPAKILIEREQVTAHAVEINDFINKSVQVLNGEMREGDILEFAWIKAYETF